MIPATSALLTDLYQLTMLQGYHDAGMADTAVFEFFVRRLRPVRGFLLAAGLEQALDYLEQVRFTAQELEWLASTRRFSAAFLASLETLRFTGDVHAMPEGTAFFPNEPILRVTAPIAEAQLVETRLINLLHFATLIASKAARSVLMAPGKLLVDFGLRRAHGAEAGLLAARASYLAGFSGTSTVLAGEQFGIPLFGTMAHSFIQAHDDEALAFARFAHAQPDNVVLLIDTWDTEAAARRVVALAPRLAAAGIRIKGVRIDSGDLAEHARRVRAILDAGGLRHVIVFVSGDLDETLLRDMLAAGAPIDGFGVGTHLDTSSDLPYLDCAYKLQEYAGRARRKRSEGKATWPGRKQVYRRHGDDGRMLGDVVTLEGDDQAGEPLLAPVMRGGRRLAPSPSLDTIRSRSAASLAALPEPLRRLEPFGYPVEIAPAVRALAVAVDRDAIPFPSD
ncbi:nicotinate phosphoribosyltransferase [Thiobacillus sedimenti]|uniref:Nicotinate phosphoribosyltransferase n=1 Tax=Thiobacillus sedimenti TaxID=3110231 RepID=A0ABZ1CMB5_9PROT|nr:nicotinate phosphoribosyltransferase [Thiobacillus sp. SCUT-2]WRS40432.1 nicotinate phosphoribosyltransferase [Thiobacillus sp. SCUT-2]